MSESVEGLEWWSEGVLECMERWSNGVLEWEE